jgi:hypothetical protein
MEPILESAAEQWGIHFMDAPNAQFQPDAWAHNSRLAMDAAQPTMITQSNSAVLAILTTYIDPKIIDVLTEPMKAVAVAGDEVKKGDWLTDTIVFPMVESTGEVSSYGDFSNNGMSDANLNDISRQSYHYQTIVAWGERELERAGLNKVDWANQKRKAGVLNLNKFQNKSYFYGISGLKNYGLLNDPNLLPSITPPANAAGGIGWGTNSTAVALDVVNGVRALFGQLMTQAGGLIDRDTKMTLAMAPVVDAEAMTLTVQYGLNVEDFLKKDFPNMKIVTAPEYATSAGNLVQLFVDELDGQRTASVAFTEKLRGHPMIVELSSFKQKHSQGTWGAIIYRPFLVASMLGV